MAGAGVADGVDQVRLLPVTECGVNRVGDADPVGGFDQ